MKINLFCIAKKEDNTPISHYQKCLKSFGVNLQIKTLFSNKLTKTSSKAQILQIYSELLSPFLGEYNFSLCIKGKLQDSFEFAKIFDNKSEVCFFIGGAFGLEEEFINKTNEISLSPLTFSHELAKIVLCEQIYRAFSIKNNHPYHKA
ncbi:MAG: 23S rRNA (pseudouridine(1915)-N(3))-methyltransferase RlmH [Helicobacter sp.]|nr:23S rRNA (pseudouridine(1915)-N(3))-methyltransferase RlmH [Helicobacter sp.]